MKTYETLAELVLAVRSGEETRDIEVCIDNDNVNAYVIEDVPEDEWGDYEPKRVWRSGYGPWVVLEDLLKGLGVKAGSV